MAIDLFTKLLEGGSASKILLSQALNNKLAFALGLMKQLGVIPSNPESSEHL